MKRGRDSYEMKIIDKYYDKHNKNVADSDTSEYEKKLKKSLGLMSKINESGENVDINIMSIISEGEEVKNKRKNKRENLIFILTCSLILLSTIIIGNFVGITNLLYVELVIALILPFTIIIALGKNYYGGQHHE
ncbi:MAG: hypothetical protein K0R54_1227 [Clostridiaceae bacterium]|jgi:hypothetical protein|nr:hypothetical protein [Clostridiaceae bacterium]